MAKKGGLIALAILSIFLSLSFVSALTVTQSVISDVVAKELTKPATLLLNIDNSDGSDMYIEFTNFIDISLAPKGSVLIAANSKQDIVLEIYPGERTRKKENGGYTFVYYIKDGLTGALTEERAIIRILSLKDIISLNFSTPLALDSTIFPIEVTNNENIDLSKIELIIDSNFFYASDTFSLEPYESKTINARIDASKLKGIKAGKYLVTTIMTVNNEGTIEADYKVIVEEKENIETTLTDRGFLLFPIITINKKNIGTVPTTAEIVVEKNLFSRPFTTFSANPDSTNAGKNIYQYIWQKELQPGESFEIEVKTNYLLPVGFLAALIFVVVILTITLKQKVIVRKRAVKVQTKGGEYALKIIITVKAKENIKDITLTDKFPHLTEIHERFGTVTPDHIDSKKKIVEWHMADLNKGEDRIFTYIIYSRVKILGSLLLPAASLIFSLGRKKKRINSNTVYFISQEY